MRSFQFFRPPKSIDRAFERLKTKPASYWEKRGRAKILSLFHYVAESVPAYQKLLDKHGIKPSQIKTIQDFQKLPLLDKDSYLRKYEYLDLFPNRDISRVTTFSATSGSTGEPFYFPRGEEQDWQYEYVAELFLNNQFDIKKKKTLGIIGFGLGIWIGGIFTYKNFNKIAQKGYNLSLVPVGPNKELYLKSLKKFAGLFDQILLMGYPPFIKDIIDEGPQYEINWKNYNIKILTATEHFSEEFRKYLAQRTFLKNPYTDIINIYGTVELGTMAHETPLANLTRKIASEKPEAFKEIFPYKHRLPTLAQYHPYIIYFEQIGEEVIASGLGSSIPLLRYRFPDRGGILGFDSMTQKLKEQGIDILEEARRAKIEHTIFRLPFVYVYERSDFATTLFGINIYTEYIRKALAHRSVRGYTTGKSTMLTKNDKNQDQFLEVNVELKKDIRPSKTLKRLVQDVVAQTLMKTSTEYNYLYNNDPKKYRARLTPKVVLWPYEHPQHFQVGGKQRWVKK